MSQPIPDENRPFRMTIESVHMFQPPGEEEMGVVICGEVESGSLHNDDTVVVMGSSKTLLTTVHRVWTYNGPHSRFRPFIMFWQNTLPFEDLEVGMVVTNQDEQ